MADDITKTTEQIKQQIENVKLLKAAMEDLEIAGSSAFAELSKVLRPGTESRAAYDEIAQSIQEALGSQFKYATELEKTLLLNQEIAKAENLRLQKLTEQEQIQKQLNSIEQIRNARKEEEEELNNKITEAQKKLLDVNESVVNKAKEELEELEKQKKELEKQWALSKHKEKAQEQLQQDLEKQLITLKAITGFDGEDLETLRAKIEALRAENQARSEANTLSEEARKLEETAEAITQNRLESTLGIKDTTADFVDLLIDAQGDAEKLANVAAGVEKAFKKAFDPKVLIKSLKNFIQDQSAAATKNIFGLDGLIMRYAELGKRLTQTTGATKEFGVAAQQLTDRLRAQGFTLAETEQAMGGLYMSSAAFTRLAAAEQKNMGEFAAQLTSLGVATDNFAVSMDKLLKVFKFTPAQTRKITTELSNFGRTLGIGPNKALQQFNQQMPLLARYGREQGIEIFKQLATTAHMAGIEMSDLVNVAKQFDTFEGAAEAAANLNFVLGGPLLNSMDLINANEVERIQILKDAMAQSGKSFNQLGRFQKDLIAQQLGVGVDVAQALFSDENVNTIEEATAKIKEQAGELGSLKNQSKDVRTEAQKRAAAEEKLLDTAKELIPLAKTFNELLTKLKGALALLGPLFIGLNLTMKIMAVARLGVLSKAMSGLTTAMTGGGGAGGGVAGALNQTTRNMSGFGESAGRTVNQVNNVGNAARNSVGGFRAMSGAMRLAAGAAGALVGALGNVAAAKLRAEGKEDEAKVVGALSSAASGAAMGFAAGGPLGAAIGGGLGLLTGLMSFEKGTDNLPRYATGIDSISSNVAIARHGKAVITGDSSDGKAKPELTVAPPASSVINNKNLETMSNVINSIINTTNNTNTTADLAAADRKQVINVTMTLDGEVLAKHTREISRDVMETSLSLEGNIA